MRIPADESQYVKSTCPHRLLTELTGTACLLHDFDKVGLKKMFCSLQPFLGVHNARLRSVTMSDRFSSVKSLDRLVRRRDMRDDLAETLFQSFLR